MCTLTIGYNWYIHESMTHIFVCTRYQSFLDTDGAAWNTIAFAGNERLHIYVYVMHLKSLRMPPLHGSLLGSDVRILSESTAVSHRTIPCYSVPQGWCLEIICLVGFALPHDPPNIAGLSGLVWLVSLPSTVQLPPTEIPTFSLKPLLQRPVGFTAETLAVNPLFEQLWSGIKINETVKWCKLDNRSRKDPQHDKAASS